MENLLNFKTNKLQIRGLDTNLGLAIITIVNLTALSVYRDGGFCFYFYG